MQSTRRELLRSFALFGAAVVATRTLAACAVDPDAESTGQNEDALVSCGAATIGSNHGHSLTVPAADVAAGAPRTYSIKGTSGHDHLVTLTAADFATLAAGGSVTVVSSNVAGHTHPVTVTCAVVTEPDAGTSEPDAGACATTSISANHGHALTVPRADVTAGVEKTYSIQGTSGHPHAVTLTPSDFADLAAGVPVTIVSTNVAGHTHSVTVSCA